MACLYVYRANGEFDAMTWDLIAQVEGEARA